MHGVGSPPRLDQENRGYLKMILLASYVYNIHQDTKSVRLIAVCERTFKLTRAKTQDTPIYIYIYRTTEMFTFLVEITIEYKEGYERVRKMS